MRLVPLLATAGATLSSLVAAVPSPQVPPPSVHRPAWRSVTDRIIRSIWSIDDVSSRARHEAATTTTTTTTTTASTAARVSTQQSGDVVVRFNISSAAHAEGLADAADSLFLDLWEYTDDWVDVRLQKDLLPSLLGLLPPTLHRAHSLIMDEQDLSRAIMDTYPSPRSARQLQPHSPSRHDSFGPALGPSSNDNIFFSDYQPFSVIQPWMRLMASLFTTHVRLFNIGISYEGRDIPALRVGVHPTNDDAPTRRKTVLITGGLHAREWVSTSTVNYLAYSLVTGYGKDHTITALLQDFDWVFVPTINPDGYVYTWETDRLWRKNRQQTQLRFCRGLDLDRSFAFQWDGARTRSNPCSESFAGSAPFEAVESMRLADWARNETENNNVDFVALLDLHSYSQQILYPYSYSCDEDPPSLENLQELAAGLSKTIRIASGRIYQSTPACEGNVGVLASGDRKVFPRFEGGGGSFLDWFYHDLKVHYTYQIKLRDRGTYGFLLPKEHIVPTGKEVLDAVLYLGRYLGGQLGVAEERPVEVPRQGTPPDRGQEVEPALQDPDTDDAVMQELRRRRA